MWTWINGTQSVSSPGVYGLKGVAAAANVPAGLEGPAMALDPRTQILYIFGGTSFAGL